MNESCRLLSVHYLDENRPASGSYEVFKGAEGARWRWSETAHETVYEEYGPWRATVAEAYRDAADDWEENGVRGSRRLVGQLRAAAAGPSRGAIPERSHP